MLVHGYMAMPCKGGDMLSFQQGVFVLNTDGRHLYARLACRRWCEHCSSSEGAVKCGVSYSSTDNQHHLGTKVTTV